MSEAVVHSYRRPAVNRILPAAGMTQIRRLSFSVSFSKSPENHPILLETANHVPLSPISFLERASRVFGDRTSVVYGPLHFTWRQTRDRCVRLASALADLGISTGDVVATLAPNIPAMHELHFAVPMAGAVLCTLNTRHNSSMISVLLKHSESKILFVDYELLDLAIAASDHLTDEGIEPPILVVITDGIVPCSSKFHDYERFIANGRTEFDIKRPKSEFDPISVNYISGTSSRPKGVVYSHRGAYLNTLSNLFLHEMAKPPVYLWTVPMFHANGWCLVWGVAALGGTNVCLRKVSAKNIFENVSRHKVTHLAGAPTVLNMIVNSSPTERDPLPHVVEVMTGASPPPPQIFLKMEEMGFRVSHMYGLTETYGPGTSSVWKPEWDRLSSDDRLKMRARQGIPHLGLEEVDVKDPETLESVPNDGKTVGEIMFRGNTVMSGYLKDPEATEAAFRGGWFRTGDLGVMHPDRYLEVKDRSKDIIISGGENVSSVEVERVLYCHPAVVEAAVVGRPDNHWGQTVCAFVKLNDGFEVKEDEMIRFCRDRLPHYMAPRTVLFQDLPTTSTGKVQKFLLRDKAKSMGSLF
ncbi:butanoate--CoA ligase AAE1-like [Impatiens glandulifera]|uniref:butanoate--CoA ligase AAE1-like n=1 Tax=Impatiens glandulifera TaxID=253017 RepID=UPI001FB0ED3F|nr:butanoate--CoA ligase AAE1-like [Impatiens glandulifera]